MAAFGRQCAVYFLIGLALCVAFPLAALGWGLKTEPGMVICNSRSAAEKLRMAHEAASFDLTWPKELTIEGCHFVNAGLRIQPVDADAHDPDDYDIMTVILTRSCEVGWTTDWIYSSRTAYNDDENRHHQLCNYGK